MQRHIRRYLVGSPLFANTKARRLFKPKILAEMVAADPELWDLGRHGKPQAAANSESCAGVLVAQETQQIKDAYESQYGR